MEARFRAGVAASSAQESEPKRGATSCGPPERRKARARRDRPHLGHLRAVNLDTNTIFDVNPAAEALFASDSRGSSRLALELHPPNDQLAWPTSNPARCGRGRARSSSPSHGPRDFVRRGHDRVNISRPAPRIFLVRERLKRIA